MRYKVKQRVNHELHGDGEVIAIEGQGDIDARLVLTIRFDNDKEHPLRLSLVHHSDKLTSIKDF